MDVKDIEKIIEILSDNMKDINPPVITLIALQEKDPFKVLISTIISLRTKDEVTIIASKKLFKYLKKPLDIKKLNLNDIENLIYPAGFYREKSKRIRDICYKLINKYDSKVPYDVNELLKFKGVGRKTANLVLSEGFGISSICVDTHVHRISNRLGIVRTLDPKDTEYELQKKIPKRYWIKYNTLLVSFGQSICRPISPWCSLCPIEKYCNKINVIKYR